MWFYVDLRSQLEGYKFKLHCDAEITHGFNSCCSRGLVVWHYLFKKQAYSCMGEQNPSNAFFPFGPRPLLLSSAEYWYLSSVPL